MELPQTVALPASCNYELPPYLPDSARCYYVSVSPSNNQSTSAIAFPPSGGTAFVANSGCTQSPFTNVPFNFDIPCSGGASTFIDTTSSTLNGRLAVVVGTAGIRIFSVVGTAAFSVALRIFSCIKNGCSTVLYSSSSKT